MADGTSTGTGNERPKFTLLPGDASDASGLDASLGSVAPDFGRGADSGSGDDFDPNIHIDRNKRNADGSYRRKRGRRAGGGNSVGGTTRKEKTNQASLEALQRMLAIIHVGLAAASKNPELELADDDARALTLATANVLEQFDVKPDPKIEAVVGLVITAGSIYGPKLYLIRERKLDEREAQRKQQQGFQGIQVR